MASGWRSTLGDVSWDTYCIARDVAYRNGTGKQFKNCKDDNEYEYMLLESGMKHLYEVIPDGYRTPVWFFADHDCKSDKARGMQEAEFIRDISSAYRAHFGISDDDSAKVMFVASSCRPDKLSIHVKINVRTTLMEAKTHAVAAFSACGDERIMPDMSVYSRTQQIRAIGKMKLGTTHVKRPIRSEAWYQHLVRIIGTGQQEHLVGKIARIDSIPPQSDRRRASEETEALRRALSNSMLPMLLGPLFSAETCHIEATEICGTTLRCIIDGTDRTGGTLTCPFAQRVHRSNRSSVAFSGGEEGEVTFRCMDPDCRGRRIVLPYKITAEELGVEPLVS